MEVSQWATQPAGEPNERIEEARKIRRLQVMMSMVMSVISQDPDLTVEERPFRAALLADRMGLQPRWSPSFGNLSILARV